MGFSDQRLIRSAIGVRSDGPTRTRVSIEITNDINNDNIGIAHCLAATWITLDQSDGVIAIKIECVTVIVTDIKNEIISIFMGNHIAPQRNNLCTIWEGVLELPLTRRVEI